LRSTLLVNALYNINKPRFIGLEICTIDQIGFISSIRNSITITFTTMRFYLQQWICIYKKWTATQMR
jgi:hypothetical protein